MAKPKRKKPATERRPLEVVYRKTDSLKPYGRNARKHPPEQLEALRASYREFGFNNPLLLRDDEQTIGAGHGRWEAAVLEGIEEVPTITLYGLTEEQWRAYVIADNRLAEGATWDKELLRLELGELAALDFDVGLTGFTLEGLSDEGAGQKPGQATGQLKERFGVVPFSVLNAREGWWQERKRAWLALGIRSEIGRGENLLRMSDTILEPDPEKRAAMKAARAEPETASLKGGLTFGTSIHPYDATGQKRNARARANAQPSGGGGGVWADFNQRREDRLGYEEAGAGTSIFDPVLCELAYRWFCPPAGEVLDPFAGGSVRGIVAARLGRRYIGVDLRPEQVEANRTQAETICAGAEHAPSWVVGDSQELPRLLQAGQAFDFVFSCPPYFDLEQYSEDERDLSNMEWEGFLLAYRRIIREAAERLRPDRFAAFVVGEVRGDDGTYRGFVRETELAFEAAGLRLYNEAVLVTAAGSLPMRAARPFETSRKLGKTHQNVLVFVKGDPVKAASAIGPCEFGEVSQDEPASDEKAPDGSQPAAEGSPAGAKSEATPYGEKLVELGGEV